jgi:hypothetical protein
MLRDKENSRQPESDVPKRPLDFAHLEQKQSERMLAADLV